MIPHSPSVPPAEGPPLTRLRAAGRVAAYLGVAVVLWLLALWPPPAWYRHHFPRETAFMSMRRRETADGRERQYRPVPLASIARPMQQAAMVAEDHRFYTHGGIDFQAIREALGYRRDGFSWSATADRKELRRAIGQAWSRRDRVRGASTITQQLAKNLYLSPSRNPLRKLKEAVTAYRLEATLGKGRILELYLNVVEFGPGIWGVEPASRAYFRKPAKSLAADQAALLAATLPSPLQANPGHRVGRIRWRQQLILRRMRGEAVVVPPPEIEDLPELKPDTAALPLPGLLPVLPDTTR